MWQRTIALLVVLIVGFASLGCGDDNKKEGGGGEAKIVVKEPIPENMKLPPLPPLKVERMKLPPPSTNTPWIR